MNYKYKQVTLSLLSFHRRGTRQCFSLKGPNLTYQSMRPYLSQSYYCQEKWNARFSDPYVKSIKPSDFYYDLTRKYKSEGKVSAVDTDIFLHSLNDAKAQELSEETEEVTRLLRRSPETINTLPSTSHALVRNLLSTQQYDLLFKILTDPLNYGVFLDFYVADILMDTLIKEENYTGASRIASMLMLQEDFGPPLTRSFVLLSCFKYAFNDKENEPWVDYHIVEEPEEEVKIIVKYIRNPYFDDHFDLKEPLHIVGKTLSWLSLHLTEDSEISLKLNSEILGWSLYEKWNSLNNSLSTLLERKEKLDESIASKIKDSITKCQDSEIKVQLDDILVKIMNEGLVSNLNIFEKIEENCKNCVNKYEKETAQKQLKFYDEWAVKRKEAVEAQVLMYERARVMKEIQEKKDDLQRREDVIFFFDNKEKWDVLLTKRKVSSKEFSHKNPIKSKVIDTEYIPPEV